MTSQVLPPAIEMMWRATAVAGIKRVRLGQESAENEIRPLKSRSLRCAQGGLFAPAALRMRIREFLRAHKTDGVGEGLGLAKLEELVQRGEVLASQQRSGIVEKRSSTKRRKNLRRALQSKLLLYLRAVGAPSNASHEALLTMARGMLAKTTTSRRSVERSRRANASSTGL